MPLRSAPFIEDGDGASQKSPDLTGGGVIFLERSASYDRIGPHPENFSTFLNLAVRQKE